MAKTILTIVVTLLTIPLFSQDYLGFTKEGIIKFTHQRNRINDNYSVHIDDTIRKTDTTNYLVVDIAGNNKIHCEYFFSKYGSCDSIMMAYHCNECAESGINEVLGKKIRKWKMFDGGYYVSTVYWEKIKKEDGTYISSPLLQIKKTPGRRDMYDNISFSDTTHAER